MQYHNRIALLLIVMGLVVGFQPGAQAQSPEKLVFALHVTISPSWFDPADTPAQITPFGILYALHDAVVRPLPGERMAPALAASWTESPDGLTYEFTLRQGLQFHNGDPCSAEDVQYSFTRYKGAGATELQAKVHQVEVVDPLTVRFTDLRAHVLGLDGFDDDPKTSNEPKLEAIQMAWYEEFKDSQA